MEFIEVEIINWSKYNKRNDYKNNSWFGLSNRFLEDPHFYSFSALQKLAWIYILSQASQTNSSVVRLNLEHAERACCIPVAIMRQTVAMLHQPLAMLRLKSVIYENPESFQVPVQNPNGSVQNPAVTLHNITLQEERSSYEDLPPTRKKSASADKVPFSMTKEIFSERMGQFWPSWVELYDEDYLNREIAKAFLWLQGNPNKNRKTMRGWSQFFSGWFDRGWDKHTTKGPSNGPTAELESWMQRAVIIHRAVIKFGSGTQDQASMREFLGNQLYSLAISAGIQKIRNLKPDGFLMRNVSQMLQDTAFRLEAENARKDQLEGQPRQLQGQIE